ncbi:hypothetical protein RZS08_23940, partial [Arthrospira platensis SPKY1]|nr:hypothetical protein [Arthrospira platensis SPKY1]
MQVLTFEDFDGSDELPEGWEIYNQSEDPTAEGWQLMDLSDTDEPDRAMVFGDPIQGRYSNNAYTFVLSPVYDLEGIGSDQTVYLEFDYAVFLEAGCDFFDVFVVEIVGDQEFETYLG